MGGGKMLKRTKKNQSKLGIANLGVSICFNKSNNNIASQGDRGLDPTLKL